MRLEVHSKCALFIKTSNNFKLKTHKSQAWRATAKEKILNVSSLVTEIFLNMERICRRVSYDSRHRSSVNVSNKHNKTQHTVVIETFLLLLWYFFSVQVFSTSDERAAAAPAAQRLLEKLLLSVGYFTNAPERLSTKNLFRLFVLILFFAHFTQSEDT